ncbi:ABC transporter ATP-binding protein [Desertimonas flava]|uniref:ABC transporter ATP-binding protein n=1 Tax=Desertimonas flava TaxID=2064846 RepID=UPI00196997C5|nr:ATP-binding cassette domain-containing protein [Desertimonas flava]
MTTTITPDAMSDEVAPRPHRSSPAPTPSPSGTDAVVVDGLTKRYGSRTAVDDVSFSIPSGTVAGLIGPNGAGKTTIMAMLLGLVRPTSGDATVLGAPIAHRADYLSRVGALIEGPAFHPGVSGVDNLRSLAVLGGFGDRRAEIDGLIDVVGLTGRGGDRYGSYSLGMKQRLGIAASLLGDPDLVILDEPTNGLDPMGMQDIRNLIREISGARDRSGTGSRRTVLVSSHLLSELEQVCDWLIVLDRGGLVHLGTPASLGGTADTLVVRPDDAMRLADLAVIVGSANLPTDTVDDTVVVTLDTDVGKDEVRRLAGEINRRSHAAGIVLTELHHRQADLEARYLNLVNNGIGRIAPSEAAGVPVQRAPRASRGSSGTGGRSASGAHRSRSLRGRGTQQNGAAS